MMDPNINLHHIQNIGYWCVVRDQQSNVVFNGNNFIIQNTHTNEVRYLEDTPENRQYLQLAEPPPTEPLPEITKKIQKKTKEPDPFWDKNKIKLLLTLCLDSRYRNDTELKKTRNPLSMNEIAPIIGTTAEECSKKYKSLRRTYISLLKKKRQGKDIKWIYYTICEELFQNSQLLNLPMIEIWEDNKVRLLLTLYIENLNRFRDPDCLKKEIWTEIARTIGTTEYNCYHKFKNLKRTYYNWLERTRKTGKQVKWQFYQYFQRIFYNFSPNVGPWNRNKTKMLLQAYWKIAHKFRNPKFQKKELWKEISIMVNETPNNCDRKFRNLKQTYIKLKIKREAGKGLTKWRYYKDFEDIYNSTPSTPLVEPTTGLLTHREVLLQRNQEEDYVKQLLSFYIENLEKFRDPLIKKKTLWKRIAPVLGMSADDCDRKYRNLKQTYLRLSEKRRETGKCNKWPYFSFFEQIFKMQPSPANTNGIENAEEVDDIRISELQRSEEEERERRENNVKFDRLLSVVEESNNIERERNKILLMLLASTKKSTV